MKPAMEEANLCAPVRVKNNGLANGSFLDALVKEGREWLLPQELCQPSTMIKVRGSTLNSICPVQSEWP